jgi:hypothetical protein
MYWITNVKERERAREREQERDGWMDGWIDRDIFCIKVD